jgi:hypothetical protein
MKSARVRSYVVHAREEIASDLPLYILIALYVAITIPIVGVSPHLFIVSLVVWFGKNSLLLPSLMGLWIGPRLLLAPGGRRSTAIAIVFGPERMGRFLAGSVLLLTMALFQATFTKVKFTLSQVSWGFPYDRLQADIDRALHLGADPFTHLLAFARNETVLQFVEVFYNRIWFLVIFSVLFLVAVSPSARRIRLRYIASYMLSWIIVGNVFAAIFHSAGPIFYHLATGDAARFADQLAFLSQAAGRDSASIDTARNLWEMREGGLVRIGGGISAFPSVHVAISALNAFFAFEISKRLGYAALAFLGLVMFGSVYLGWHYAIDGYAAIVIVAAIYYGMRAIMLNRWRWMPLRQRQVSAPELGAR